MAGRAEGAAAPSGKTAVCVTGAGGNVASWLVKLLLCRGYAVHGTVRDLNKEFCRNNEDWYSVAKITSEEVALEHGRQIGLDVVTINPALVLGPLLQPVCNTSCQFLVYFLKGGPDRMRDKLWHVVDVRDVAGALLLLYEAPGASGRHVCAPRSISARDLLRLYPGYPCTNKESIGDMDNPAPMTSCKLRELGWSCRPLEETIADTVEFCEQAGFLGDLQGEPCRFPPVYNKI
ncbi:hypothetical protein BAE44_0022026 [Dichanthelium oligosanthes]|uniref:NAD-dependent epimerase/dehydratase domain-containing protein n=1 Tax=Dichanthelium oligosanthes TaxID=888268 RepID=A0A1E5UVX3_9POAL|nr:hypothetical protein BAE44_0022026 [Dichanthelium oligosanthes]